VLLCKKGSQQALCLCNATYGDLLFTQVCSDAIQAYCEAPLQSSTEQWGLHFALNTAAVHLWWVTAHLCAEQISIGTTAVTQACCEPPLQSSTEQWGLHLCREQSCSAFGVGQYTPV